MNLTDQLEAFVRDLHDFIQTLDISYKECFFSSYVVMVT